MDTSGNYSRENAREDLSKNACDEALFEYYCTAQMIEVDAPRTHVKNKAPAWESSTPQYLSTIAAAAPPHRSTVWAMKGTPVTTTDRA